MSSSPPKPLQFLLDSLDIEHWTILRTYLTSPLSMSLVPCPSLGVRKASKGLKDCRRSLQCNPASEHLTSVAW